jgi:tetratricopeptide (TPR) repeat protein
MVQGGLSFACAPLRFEIGRIQYEKGNYHAAIRQLREASLLCRTGLENSDLLGQILVYRAFAHGRIGEIDAAMRLASQAVEEMRRGESRRLLAWALTMAGVILKSADEPDAARISWREAQSIYTDLHDDLAAKQLSERLSALGTDNKQ